MTAMETFIAWRDDLAAQLVDANGELAAARDQLASDEIAAVHARAERQQISAALSGPSLVAQLSQRQQWRNTELAAIEARPAAARAKIPAAARRVADLAEALDQLGEIIERTSELAAGP